MKWQISLFLVFFYTTSKGQADSALIQSFLTSNYSWNSDKADIPKSFFKSYKKLANEDFLITDDEHNFNSTDLVIKGAPNKKLVYCGSDTSQKKGFVYFLQGGIVISKY